MYDTRDEDNIHFPREILSLNIWNLPDFPNPFSFSWFHYEGKEKEEGREKERERREEERETPVIDVKLYLSKEKVKHLCTSQLTGAPGNEAKD